MNTPQLFRVSIIGNSFYRTLYPLITFLFLSINVCAYDGVTKPSKNQSTEAPRENEKKLTQTCLSLCEQFEKLARKDTLEAFKAADAIESKLPLISDKVFKARAMRCVGDCAEQRNQQAEAIEWYRQAMALLNGTSSKEAEVEFANLLMSKALVFQKNGDLQRAFELYLGAEERLFKHKVYDRLLMLYPKIGDIYLRNQLDTVQNKLYIDKAEALLPHIKDSDQIANFYIVKSNTLFYGNQPEQALGLMQVAIDILNRTEQPDQYLLGTAYYNMAYYLRNQERYREAEAFYRRSLAAYKQTGIRYDMTDAVIRIGGSLYYQERFDEAETYLLKGLAMADSIHSKVLMRNACDVLSYLEYERGRYKEAYGYLDQYVTLHLDILSEKEQSTINFLHAKHEDDKKMQQIKDLKARNTLMWLSAGGLVLVLILVLVALLYRQRSLRNERRLAQEKVVLLEREKRLVATQAVMEGETAERSRLARDLHDGLGGMLSVIKLNLHQVKRSDLMVPDDVNSLDNVLGLLDQSMQELRRVAHNMMPEALVKYGLKVALADFCRNIDSAHFHYYGEEKRLDPNLEVTVYRTAFELVNNAIKHAEAQTINIQVVQQSDRLALTVHDDGKGFDTTKKPSGHGLSNITNRAAVYGGSMDILSAPGQGTEITVEFLIQQAQ
jgi:signal transduction histidine kinase